MTIDPTERRIIEAATKIFIEKGFEETSMSDIAEAVGMTRTALHYYFRTKERLFGEVFGPIIRSLVPRLPEIVGQEDKSIGQRIGEVFDIYFSLFLTQPDLPIFVLREMKRDPRFLSNAFQEFGVADCFRRLQEIIEAEQRKGTIKQLSCRYIFMTFYGMMVMPFLMRNVVREILLEEEETPSDMHAHWRTIVVSQMLYLLTA